MAPISPFLAASRSPLLGARQIPAIRGRTRGQSSPALHLPRELLSRWHRGVRRRRDDQARESLRRTARRTGAKGKSQSSPPLLSFQSSRGSPSFAGPAAAQCPPRADVSATASPGRRALLPVRCSEFRLCSDCSFKGNGEPEELLFCRRAA